MEIIDFDKIEIDDELLVLSNYGKTEKVATVTEKSRSELTLNDGQTISRWSRGADCTAIKANHPNILQARKDYHLRSILTALSFGRCELINNPEIAALLEQIHQVDPQGIDERIESLKSMSALGRESLSLKRVADSLISRK